MSLAVKSISRMSRFSEFGDMGTPDKSLWGEVTVLDLHAHHKGFSLAI